MSKRPADFVSTDEKLQKKIASDQTLNALKQLRDLETNMELKAQIQGFIQKRIGEILDENREG